MCGDRRAEGLAARQRRDVPWKSSSTPPTSTRSRSSTPCSTWPASPPTRPSYPQRPCARAGHPADHRLSAPGPEALHPGRRHGLRRHHGRGPQDQLPASREHLRQDPGTPAGLKACKDAKAEGLNVLSTSVYSSEQGFLAAVNGADYIAPYTNRMSNYGDGVQQVKDLIDAARPGPRVQGHGRLAAQH